jgi:hypothetical protein
MTTSNMPTLMLHGTILVLTLIKGTVHTTYWSNGGLRQELRQYAGWDETPLFPFSTIIQMKEFKRQEFSAENSKSAEVLYLQFP